MSRESRARRGVGTSGGGPHSGSAPQRADRAEDMARNPSASAGRPGGGGAGRRGGKARRDNTAAPGRAEGSGAVEDDPVVDGSADPCAETDAGHRDESASDPLDDHPQPEDEAPQRPGG